MAQPQTTPGPWSLTTRVIVYSAIGAALYAVFNWISFAIQIPGAESVSVRPHYGLLTFFGFAFGPVVGFLTGFVGNVVGDQLTGWGAFTSPHWSLANGLAGMITGLFPIWMASRMTSVGSKALTAAVAGVVATVIGFLVIFLGLVLTPELDFNTILTTEYIPVVIANSIAAAIVTPILVLAWEPISAQMGR
ncbi:MAG TPA: ECF transporter S component [Pleomorphomonadaceae bacterium]|nr:ECF transporter S component [Pleomorphomonadaceae bacterium]